MFVEPLDLNAVMAAYDGGVIVRPDLSIIDEKPLPMERTHGGHWFEERRSDAWVRE
jgi:hypothetical protein